MGYEKYSLGRLFEDVKEDLLRYAKMFLHLEQVFFWDGMRVVLRFPSFWLIAFHRYGFWVDSRFKNKLIKFFMKFFCYLGKRILEIITKNTIAGGTEIGPGFCFAGKGGVILGATKIGKECTVFENVTMGMALSKNLPEIGDFVTIGPNSIIYGGIKIGKGVTTKDSTVLTKSVPDYCIVQGNPGRIIKKIFL